ncbi:hypothetical protein ABZ858_12805 [Streptomyces sp. NPDC047017]|uniref:hypothetical protein n=1 Tax=Streptomyces sp. NPDC047017 TaxID=3155024 RepID=UPI0033FD2B30
MNPLYEPKRVEKPGWITTELAGMPGIESVSYGVVRPGRHDPGGVPMIRAGDIVDGAVNESDLARIASDVDSQNRRTSLRTDDLLVVLVGRIGDTAVTRPRHHGWNAARSVAVIRFTSAGLANRISTWIRWWLAAPETRDLLRVGSAGEEHATLSLTDLKQLRVSLPPYHLRTRLLQTMSLAEQKIALNTRIATRATELADAYFDRFAGDTGLTQWSRVPIADVCQVIGGFPRREQTEGTAAIAWAAPKEVLNSKTPQLDQTAQITWAAREMACGSGTLLVAPRRGAVKTVAAAIPVVPGNGMLALRTESEADRMWLLHELRSRSGELIATTQGEQARAMSRKKFPKFSLSWPVEDVRERFAQVAVPLHARVLAAIKENHALRKLVVAEMTGRANGER